LPQKNRHLCIWKFFNHTSSTNLRHMHFHIHCYACFFTETQNTKYTGFQLYIFLLSWSNYLFWNGILSWKT
jgi:hypothetical protein